MSVGKWGDRWALLSRECLLGRRSKVHGPESPQKICPFIIGGGVNWSHLRTVCKYAPKCDMCMCFNCLWENDYINGPNLQLPYIQAFWNMTLWLFPSLLFAHAFGHVICFGWWEVGRLETCKSPCISLLCPLSFCLHPENMSGPCAKLNHPGYSSQGHLSSRNPRSAHGRVSAPSQAQKNSPAKRHLNCQPKDSPAKEMFIVLTS